MSSTSDRTVERSPSLRSAIASLERMTQTVPVLRSQRELTSQEAFALLAHIAYLERRT
jgi:hypothetical protein